MREIVSLLLPSERETRLLRTCLLGEGDPVDAVLAGGAPSPAWPPLSVVPLLADALARGDSAPRTEAERELALAFRTAGVRTHHRSRTVRRLLGTALDALAEAEVDTVVLRGAALADTVYPRPELCHCHDLDLWIAPADAERAARALEAAGFPRARRNAGADGPRHLHPGGLPLQLHHRTLRLSFHEPPAELFPGPAETATIAGRRALVPAPAEQLFHVLGHAASGPGRDTLRWACDAWFLLRARTDLDADRFVALAERARIALPLSVQLPFLRDSLGAAIPDGIVERVTRAAARSGPRELEAAVHGALCGRRGTVRAVLAAAPGGRARLRAARWILLPSPTAVRWRRPDIGRAGLALHYMARPLRGIAGAVRRAHSGGRLSPEAEERAAMDLRETKTTHIAIAP